jgi:hypothetical protein
MDALLYAALTTGPAARYDIERALLCDGAASMSRTPGAAGNRKGLTVNLGVKRAKLGTLQYLFSCGDAASDYYAIFLDTSDRLNIIRVIGSSTDAQKISTRVFRDPSAHGSLTVILDAANTSLKAFWSGEEITSWSTDNDPSNIDGPENNTVQHTIGARSYSPSGTYFEGIISEPRVLDGVTPSDDLDFVEQNADTGQFDPRFYSGSYGAQGARLLLNNNASTTTLGEDASDNGNDWTLTGFTTADSVEDTPTNNFCVLNAIDTPLTLSEGGLGIGASGGGDAVATFRHGDTPRKAYFELDVIDDGFVYTGLLSSAYTTNDFTWVTTTARALYLTDGQKYGPSGLAAYGSATQGGIVMVAIDFDAGKIWWGLDGTWFASGDPVAGTNPGFDDIDDTWRIFIGASSAARDIRANFGQKDFAHTPPAGFLPLSTKNLPDPLIANPKLYFDTLLYTGTGAAQAITGAEFQPNLVWTKDRGQARDHYIYDTERVVGDLLSPNLTNAEIANAGFNITAMINGGFDLELGNQSNETSQSYAAWLWKQGITPGFDIVTYTGDGVAGRTVAHGLGDIPAMMIVKNRDRSSNWLVYHKNVAADPETDYLILESTAGVADLNIVWNDTAPTSSVFTVGTSLGVNAAGENHIAYLFAEVPGFSAFGSYTGNGSADGRFVNLGFRPAFVMIKRVDVAGHWSIKDATRGPNNLNLPTLYPHLSNAEDASGVNSCDFVANGFKWRGTDASVNASGGTYIYAAFAQAPFKFANAA